MSRRVYSGSFPSLVPTLICAGSLITLGCGASGAAKGDGGESNNDPMSMGGAIDSGEPGQGGGSGNPRTGGAPGVGSKATGGANSGTRPTGGRSAAGGNKATGGTTTSGSLNPPITGSEGYATRYWDCCKPSCAWTTAVPACQKDGKTRITDRNATSGCDGGGYAYECYDFAPWFDASTNMSYGFAAYNAAGCGTCFQLQFTGTSNGGSPTGAAAIKGKQMIVQVINIGNIAAGQFDLLIPGGGVGERTAGCTAQWGQVELGATYGGLLLTCNNDPACMASKCQSVFGSIPAMLAGCNWFTDWFSSADNPRLIYKQVSCPSQLTSKSGVSG